jgi:hypothetical protein
VCAPFPLFLLRSRMRPSLRVGGGAGVAPGDSNHRPHDYESCRELKRGGAGRGEQETPGNRHFSPFDSRADAARVVLRRRRLIDVDWRAWDVWSPYHYECALALQRGASQVIAEVAVGSGGRGRVLRLRPRSISLDLRSADGKRRLEPPRREGRGLPAALRDERGQRREFHEALRRSSSASRPSVSM